MPHTRVRSRGSGLTEIQRVGRLHEVGVTLGVMVLALPALLVLMMALVTVLPVIVIAVPPAVVAAATLAAWAAHRERRPVGSRRAPRTLVRRRFAWTKRAR